MLHTTLSKSNEQIIYSVDVSKPAFSPANHPKALIQQLFASSNTTPISSNKERKMFISPAITIELLLLQSDRPRLNLSQLKSTKTYRGHVRKVDFPASAIRTLLFMGFAQSRHNIIRASLQGPDLADLYWSYPMLWRMTRVPTNRKDSNTSRPTLRILQETKL